MYMKFNKKIFISLLFVLLAFSISSINAEDVSIDDNSTADIISIEDNSEILSETTQEGSLCDDSDEVVVNNWDELQYYCSLKDRDYTLKLKENTNFYPTNPQDSNYQIKVYNNVKIIGSEGSYIGDNSSNPSMIKFTAIVVPDDYRSSISLENITFKSINSDHEPDGVFIQIAGKYNSVLKNCYFEDILTNVGHSSIVYLKKGTATMENCSFINCTTDFGCVGIYDPFKKKTVKMIMRDCYFEGNYAETEPGCINNCGELIVYNSTFYRNSAFWWAGAIHTHNNGNTTIYDSNFTDNLAGWNGGALYTYSYLQVYNTVFVGNNCTTNNGGGAIGACEYISNPHIYIENCLFANNENLCWALDELSTTGTGRGGAISLMDEGSIIVLNTTFIANSASIGTAICAIEIQSYGSPDIIIKGNRFINHTRAGDVLNVRVEGTKLILEDNYFSGNSIEFSQLTLNKLSEDENKATLEIKNTLKNPNYYDEDILDKTSYDVYVDGVYKKTVGSRIFTVDFDDFDEAEVYVIPTISNLKSNSLNIYSTRDYVYVSKSNGSDSNNGQSRTSPVNTIQKALELASGCHSIWILDGEYDEKNLQVNYDLAIKGNQNVILTNSTSFIVSSNQLTLKNIMVKELDVSTFINQLNGNLTIYNCIFEDNRAENIIDANSVNISKSIFINNGACIIRNNEFSIIRNSVLLNNTNIVSGNLANYDFDYNWWGNTNDNYDENIVSMNLNNWIFLNVESNVKSLEYNQQATVEIGFNLFDNNSSVKYSDLVKFDIGISAVHGVCDKNIVSGNSKIKYQLKEATNGLISFNYNNIGSKIEFAFVKSNPNISIKSESIMVGDDLIVKVIVPDDATGSMILSVGNISKTMYFSGNNVMFTFGNLNAGNYNITASYSGNVKYPSQTKISTVNVNKYESFTKIHVNSIEEGDDLVVTVTTTNQATGNIMLSVNGEETVLDLTSSEATYKIKNISRGDYNIRAVYNGDGKFKSSENSLVVEVGNVNSQIDVVANDCIFGEFATFEINLDDNASGYVNVTVDGITNTSKVFNGYSKVYLAGIGAGLNKSALIFYSGDNNYFNLTYYSSVNVKKANLTFNISSKDIKIGHDAIITISVPAKTEGTFKINGDILTIPMSGELSYVISNLDIGNYTFTAFYQGNNYNMVQNSTSFKVTEFENPIWSNDGANIENTGKSDYAAYSNGTIFWNNQINSTIIGNLAIDDEGNIYLVTVNGIYSFDLNGNLRWIYNSDGFKGNFSGISIGRDIIISPRQGDRLYLINQTSGNFYGYSNIYQASSLFAPLIDSNATIYVVSEYQFETSSYNVAIVPYKLWGTGGDPVLVSLDNHKPMSSPTINDDLIVILCEGQLRIFDLHNFNVLSTKTSNNFKNIRPIIGDGNIVYAVLGDSIVSYSNLGKELWKIRVSDGIGENLRLDNDLGILYATNSYGNLYGYDIFTREETLITDLSITSGILIDANHNLYFGCDNIFYGIDSEGKILWKTDLGSKVTGNPVMNKNGTIYVTTEDNKLFALGNSINIANDTNTSEDTNSTLDSSTPSNVNPSNGGGKTVPTTKVIKKSSKITAKKKTFKAKAKTKKYTITLKSGKSPIRKVTLTIKVGKKTFKAKTNSKGKATFKIKLKKKGKYTVKITFRGNKYYKATTKKVKIVLK